MSITLKGLNGGSVTIATKTIDALAAKLRGALLRPGEPGMTPRARSGTA